eukprot:1241375-Pleurochrysis_carterae.AAC.1
MTEILRINLPFGNKTVTFVKFYLLSSPVIKLPRLLLHLQGPHFGNTSKLSDSQTTCASTTVRLTQRAPIHFNGMLNGFLMSAMES